MPNKERIDKIFIDVRKKVAKNANFPESIKQKFNIDIDSSETQTTLTKKQ